MAQSLENLVDNPVPQNVLKFRLVCDYQDGEDTVSSLVLIVIQILSVFKLIFYLLCSSLPFPYLFSFLVTKVLWCNGVQKCSLKVNPNKYTRERNQKALLDGTESSMAVKNLLRLIDIWKIVWLWKSFSGMKSTMLNRP